MKCPRCGSENTVKNGFAVNKQRYKCKRCGYQSTRSAPRGKDPKDRQLAAFLYASGLSMTLIAKLVNVSVQTVSRWLHSIYNGSVLETPHAEPFKRVSSVDILEHLSHLSPEELHREYLLLSTTLPSRGEVKMFISSPTAKLANEE